VCCQLNDLMVMAVKYQVLLCKRPQDLLLITLNHLDEIRTFLWGDSHATDLLDHTYSLLFTVSRGALDPDPDPDPVGYPMNLVDPAGIWIRPDPMYLDPVRIWMNWIRIRPDLRQDPVNTGQIYITMT